jgi:hypothetical protein
MPLDASYDKALLNGMAVGRAELDKTQRKLVHCVLS